MIRFLVESVINGQSSLWLEDALFGGFQWVALALQVSYDSAQVGIVLIDLKRRPEQDLNETNCDLLEPTGRRPSNSLYKETAH